MTQDIRKYDFIDAVRGYAILLVLLLHSAQSVPPISATLRLLADGGARGVQLFYIASAFTLCMSWRSRSGNERRPVRNFFLRRFFRIAPMFYIAIVFYVLWYGCGPRYWAPNGVEWWFVPLTALFLHGFHPETITSVVPGGWSIAVEMNFYLLLPLLLPRLATVKSSAYFFLFTLVVYGVSRIAVIHIYSGLYPPSQQYLVTGFAFLNFFSQLPVFALGIFAYGVFSSSVSLSRVVIFGNVAAASLLSVLLLFPAPIIVRAVSHHILAGAALALFVLTLGRFPVKVLVNRGIAQLGKISFSMYLTHYAVLDLFSRWGISALFPGGNIASVLHALCVVLVTAALSYLLWNIVERRGILLGKKLIDRLERRPTSDGAFSGR